MKRVWVFLVGPLALALACNGGVQATPPATRPASAATLTVPANGPQPTSPPNGPTAAAPGPTFSAPTPDPNTPALYVAPDGSDSAGDGSAAAPWASITHALDSVHDGALILVRPGLYTGRVRIRGRFAQGVTVRSEVPYRAQLRADETVLTIFEAQGITLEGFDVAHSSPAAEPLLVQIQDNLGEAPGGAEFTSRITLRNNLLHDSYNNDLLKINNGAQQITISGNIFYNQGDSDEHIDVNSVRDVVIEDNIFFNAFEASGRPVTRESSSFIVVKDSNGDEDGLLGVSGLTIRRNIFLHYQGSDGMNMVLLGEDGAPYFEAGEVLIENNLFLGDGAELRAPFGTKGVHNVVFRQNTISGDMPGRAFAWRSNVEGENHPNENIQLYNNLYTDPTGTMNNFATAPAGETASFTLRGNLYWNGGQPLPGGTDDSVQISADLAAIFGDPRLPAPVGVPLPVWDAAAGRLGGGAADIRAAFRQLVLAYGVPQAGSAALDQADPSQTSGEDILGQPRSGAPDLGAYELQGGETALVLPTSAPAPTAAGAASASPAPGGAGPQPTLPLPTSGGWVIFTQRTDAGDRLFRLALTPNAVPDDISARLAAAAAGQAAAWGALAPDGAWFLLSTDRFDPGCAGWPCLVLTQDFTAYEVVRSAGAPVHAESSAVAAGGGLIVYQTGGGPHNRDLWAIRRAGSAWSAPVLLTAGSPFSNHQRPSLSADGARVVLACGNDPYFTTALCEAQTDGSGFQVRWQAAPLGPSATVFSPGYAPDGSLVFEGRAAGGEQLWRLPAGSDTPALISSLTGDNAPCVLPDGSLVSLWRGRPGSGGAHELKLMAADGRQYAMLLAGLDVFDVGLGCGAPG